MPKIKIKHEKPKERQTKQQLLEILAKNNIYATRLISIPDAILVLTTNDEYAEKIFSEKCQNELIEGHFQPIAPPELIAKKSVIIKNADELVYDHDSETIKEEI